MPDLPPDLVVTVTRALDEDIGTGDVTAALIPVDRQDSARIILRERAVLCGIPWANEVLHQVDPDIDIEWQYQEGDDIEPGRELALLSGRARSLLTAERCMLNFLQALSGTATLSRRLASLVAHTRVRLLDTRKTLPGLRTAQKYAVAVGGCQNHRMGLFDAFLIKENHIQSCSGITAAVNAARKLGPGRPVEVEVETVEQLHEAIAAGADTVMLDNFDLSGLKQAVKMNNGRVKLEASGGVEESQLVAVAETGVDFISIGALTKHCRAIDMSLRFF